MDVASWLRSLGLEQYEAVFRENAIDLSVLPDLTNQDLEKLGVLLGHRRKLLRATALDAMLNKPRRCVALHRDDDEFVITFQPIASRSAATMQKHCARFAPSCDGRS